MNIVKSLYALIFLIFLVSCADYKLDKTKKEKIYYSSKGFALIYESELYEDKIINKKINNEDIKLMHSILKVNTPIKIINPENLKTIETKIHKNGKYPKIFNIVVSKKVANLLELDIDNPYVEIIEIKKNRTFIAKKANTFDEEKNVAEKVPVKEIKMDDLSSNKIDETQKKIEEKNFILVINDFYYSDSAYNLMNELTKKTNIKKFSVKKINNNKYRLLVGPFKNFNALKNTYISLNNLGFEDLNIYKE